MYQTNNFNHHVANFYFQFSTAHSMSPTITQEKMRAL